MITALREACNTRMQRLRDALTTSDRIVVITVALGLTVATWGPMLAVAVGHGSPLWEAFVHEACDPFCHQLPERSFHVRGHAFPLCARCTGMWLGITLGVVAALSFVRRHRWELGAVVAISATALSAMDQLREESSLVGWPLVRAALGLLLFGGVTWAVSYDMLAVLAGGVRQLARTVRGDSPA